MIKTAQKNIRHLSLKELEQYFETIGEKKFRVKQVWEWLWQKSAQSFADMTNLSKELRQKLGEHFFPARFNNRCHSIFRRWYY